MGAGGGVFVVGLVGLGVFLDELEDLGGSGLGFLYL